MRCLPLVLALGLLVNTSFAQPTGPDANQTSPQSPEQKIPTAINNFVSSLNTGRDFNIPQYYVYHARRGYYSAVDWFKTRQRQQGMGKIEVVSTNIDKIDGPNATVTVTYKIKSSLAPVDPKNQLPEKSTKETVRFRFNESKAWQIVPPNEKPEIWPKEGATYVTDRINFINEAAYELAQLDWKYSPEENVKLSTERLKALNLATLQFRQDYNEVYAFAPQHMQDALSPYMADRKAFSNPITGEAYGFNGYLCGKSSDSIRQPEWTVLFYEGQDQKPIFRYDGKALIAYVDGHVKLVTPAEADDLIWKF